MTQDPRSAIVQSYQEVRAELMAAIDGLSDAQLTDLSFDGWSVKDHLAHLIVWDEIRAGEIARISAGGDCAWPTTMTEDQVESLNTMTVELRRGLSARQILAELATSRQRVIAAIMAATPRGLDASLYGASGLQSTHDSEHAGWIRAWRDKQGI